MPVESILVVIPTLRLHAGLHVTVENQVLLGDETPVAAALERLIGEGPDRHDAIHAIASVLSGVMYDAVTRKDAGDPKASYYSEVGRFDRRRLAVAGRLNVTSFVAKPPPA